MAALVAKSYEGLEQLCEPYETNGRMYVKVKMKNGSTKVVRAYSEKEYEKFYPEVKIIRPAKSKRDVFGFGEAGYIWLFKNADYEDLEFFKASPCRYARPLGWYLPSDIEMPDPLPVGVEPVKFTWEQASENDQMLPEDKLKLAAEEILYDPGKSEFVGEVGDKVEIDAVCIRAVTTDGMYGISYFFIFEDEDENVYTWTTATRPLEEGVSYHIKGTVKGHTTYRNVCQTVLSRCKVEVNE